MKNRSLDRPEDQAQRNAYLVRPVALKRPDRSMNARNRDSIRHRPFALWEAVELPLKNAYQSVKCAMRLFAHQ